MADTYDDSGYTVDYCYKLLYFQFSFHVSNPEVWRTICTGIFGDLDSTYLQYHSNPLFDSVEKMVFVQSEKIVIQINF